MVTPLQQWANRLTSGYSGPARRDVSAVIPALVFPASLAAQEKGSPGKETLP